MSTKVFSTRLDSVIVEGVKTLSKDKNQKIQHVVEDLLNSGLKNNSFNRDPWADFVMNAEFDLSSELIDKRTKNLKTRRSEKEKLLVDV